MRIIAGRFRSRVLKSVPGRGVRPTPDRLRESLFSILAPQLYGCHFVDAYAGSGAVGLEAISRGAAIVTLIERSPAALQVLRENVATLGLSTAEIKVRSGAASRHLIGLQADIVFLDPPYTDEREYGLAFAVVDPNALVIVQHSTRLTLPDATGSLRLTRQVRQGDNILSFYRNGEESGQLGSEANT